MTHDKQQLERAIEYVVTYKLKYWDAYKEHDSYQAALQYTMGSGGGFSLPDWCEPFWLADYKSNLSVVLWYRSDGQEKVHVSRSQLMRVAERVWHRLKHKSTQLTLQFD